MRLIGKLLALPFMLVTGILYLVLFRKCPPTKDYHVKMA